MNIYLEKIEDFMELLEKNKPVSIFIKKYSELNENKLLHGQIRLQFNIENDIINYTEVKDIPSVQLPLSDDFISGASLFIDANVVKQASTKIDNDIKNFYKKLDDEYLSVKELFTSKGYVIFEGFIQ